MIEWQWSLSQMVENLKEGYQVIVGTTDDDSKKEADLIESMLERQVEGIIINTSTNSDKMTMKS